MKLHKLTILGIVSVITGCTAINSTSFSDLSSAYREVVEEYSNNNILLNIVRTSKNMPMSFLDIPSVIGTGNVVGTAGATATKNNGITNLPDNVLGGSLGLSVNNGFTFTQASLDNAQFMQSFLKPIPLNILRFKGTETLLPKVVTSTLLIESIELRSNNSVVKVLSNDPLNPNYSDFQDFLALLLESDLTVENVTVKVPLGPPIDKNLLNKSYDNWSSSVLDGLTKGKLSLEKVSEGKRELFQLVRLDTETRICVNKHRGQQLFGNMLSTSTYCADSPQLKPSSFNSKDILARVLPGSTQDSKIEMLFEARSPGNVFNFLGTVLNAQLSKNEPKLVMIKPATGVSDTYNSQQQNAAPLFKVYKNSTGIKRAASVQYKGDTYSVADEDDSYSKQVIEFMSTLISITKIPGAIPPSPAVIVR